MHVTDHLIKEAGRHLFSEHGILGEGGEMAGRKGRRKGVVLGE